MADLSDAARSQASALFVSLDVWGNLCVADMLNQRIQKLSPTVLPLAQWPMPGRGTATPNGVAVDRQGRVYVSVSVDSATGIQEQILTLSSTRHRLVSWRDRRSRERRLRFPPGLAV